MSNTIDSIIIFTGEPAHSSSSDETMRGTSAMAKTAMRGAVEITVDTLKDNMCRFLKNLDIIISASPKNIGTLTVDAVEIYAQIDSKGNIGIVGIGGAELAARGGVKFVLRKNTNQHPITKHTDANRYA